MEWSVKRLYRWSSSGDCEVCDALQGIHDDEPEEPHDNCKCTCEGFTAVCKQIGETTQRRPVGVRYEPETTIPKNSSTTKMTSKTLGGGVSPTVGAKAEPGGVGPSAGLGASVSVSRTDQATTTFVYDKDVGGDSQQVMAEYQIFEVTVTTTWQTWPDGEQFQTVETHQDEAFARYVTVQSGRAEGGISAPRQGDDPAMVLGSGEDDDDDDFEMGEATVTEGDDDDGDYDDDE